jgi:Holliday junction resolvase RusA-like endonuclease
MTRVTTSSKVVTWESDGFTIRLPFPPTPASRPRVSRWGTYYGKTYKAYRELADKAIPQSRKPALTGNLKATIEFVCHKPKTTKRINPLGDIDNHMKAVLDAITGTKKNPKGYWKDDDQIVEVYALKRWPHPGEQPHTRIRIEKI